MKALGLSVKKAMENDEDVILITADTARDLQLYHLREDFPDRVFDFGIAEQNAVSFASARALMGQKPIFATYACFMRRAFEQIYNQVTEGTAVVYIGTMAGPLDPSGPGISHTSLDDKEYMGNLMDVYEPEADHIYKVLEEAIGHNRPTYVRILA
jgi:transketolase